MVGPAVQAQSVNRRREAKMVSAKAALKANLIVQPNQLRAGMWVRVKTKPGIYLMDAGDGGAVVQMVTDQGYDLGAPVTVPVADVSQARIRDIPGRRLKDIPPELLQVLGYQP